MSITLLALDRDFANLGTLPYINLQWERDYYWPGTFVVQMLAADYDPRTAYVFTPDRPEVGMVQQVKYQRKSSGRFVLLSGFFLEKILDDKITFTSEGQPTFYANGNIEVEVRRMVNTYKGDIPRLVLGPVAGLGSAVQWQTTGGELGKVCSERLQAQGLAYRCRYDMSDEQVYFTVWQGKDRTQAQSANSFAVFSDGFGNLGDVEILIDSSNFKNYAIVGGEGQNEQRYYEAANNAGSGYQKRILVDSRRERFDPEEQTIAQYRAGLRQNGFDKLATDYYTIENADISVLVPADTAGGDGTLVYLRDFDLGDRCDVVLGEIGLEIMARIIHVREVVKRNQHSVAVELGEAKLTRTEKARL